MTSCEKDQPVYSEETCWLNFKSLSSYESDQTEYSFVYSGSSVTQDTVWMTVTTLGFVKDYDRALAIEQVESSENDAVPGKHYVAFDDPSLQKYYVMPAGAVSTDIPVVVLRDASLKSGVVNLEISIKENENFKVGYETDRYRTITISDKLSKPSNWERCSLDYYISVYTKGVHQFMIDVSGERWDEDYISSLADYGYVEYLGSYFAKKLEEVNAERVANGLGVLLEEDGTPVKFEIDDPWS